MLQNTIYEMERPATDWEKIFTNNISDKIYLTKDLYSKYVKNFYNLTIKPKFKFNIGQRSK